MYWSPELVPNDLFPIFFYLSCSKIRVVCFWQAAVGVFEVSKENVKGLFQKNISWFVSCSDHAGQLDSPHLGEAWVPRCCIWNTDVCRPNMNLYSSLASAAQLFFLHNLSLFWLLFAFFMIYWYMPTDSTFAALSRSQQTILLGEESHMSPWNQKQEISNNKKLTQLQLDCLQLRGNVRKTWNHQS